MEFTCINCGADCASRFELREHIKNVHSRARVQGEPPPPLQPVEKKESIKQPEAEPIPVKILPPVIPPKVQEPLILAYILKGEHVQCGAPIDTIEIELTKDKSYIIGYCNRCRMKIEQHQVIPIKSQMEGHTLLKSK